MPDFKPKIGFCNLEASKNNLNTTLEDFIHEFSSRVIAAEAFLRDVNDYLYKNLFQCRKNTPWIM
jgi:hypothetical protein